MHVSSIVRTVGDVGFRRRRHIVVLSGAVFAFLAIIAIALPDGSILGADGENYQAILGRLRDDGLLARDVTYWPAGYPVLLLLVGLPGGVTDYWGITMLQAAAWCGAVGALAWQLTRTRVAWAAVPFAYVALFNPTMSLSTLAIGYESLTASITVATLALLLIDLGPGQRRWPLPVAGALLGVAAFQQPRLAVGAVALLIVWAMARRPRITTIPLTLAAIALLLVPPAALVIRNNEADGVASVSTNFGINMAIGAGEFATGGYTDTPEDLGCDVEGLSSAQRDQELVRCVLRWYAAHPGEAVRLTTARAIDFWSPWYGPLEEGTMARNPWLLVQPAKLLADTSEPANAVILGPIGLAASWVWVIGGWLLMGTGAVVLWRLRDGERTLGVAALVVIAGSWLVTAAIMGDHRFRMPVMGPILLLVVVGAGALLRRAARHWRARKGIKSASLPYRGPPSGAGPHAT